MSRFVPEANLPGTCSALIYGAKYAVKIRKRYDELCCDNTYDSFETEIAMAPKYVELTADEYAPENELKQLHDGILRDTPAGQMLETAVSYISFDSEGNATPIVFVYYDIYARGVEYCFCLHARNGNYEVTFWCYTRRLLWRFIPCTPYECRYSQEAQPFLSDAYDAGRTGKPLAFVRS